MLRKSAFAAIILAVAVSTLTACAGPNSVAPSRGAANVVHPDCLMPQVPICHG